jgi:two-component system catabolic regulation response regulator CreB
VWGTLLIYPHTMESKKHIIVVEDESSIADAITYALSTEGFTTSRFSTSQEALKYIESSVCALAVIDVGLPDYSGFELCRKIRGLKDAYKVRLPIIFLTARSEEVDRILGLELGGDDYLTKPFSPRELVARIRSVLRRATEMTVENHSMQSSLFRIDEERLKILYKETPLDLSRYEYRLLAILVKRPGRVFSREELMSRAWEDPEMSLERTVDSHIKMIRNKLRLIDPNDDSIITHRGFGYSLREES